MLFLSVTWCTHNLFGIWKTEFLNTMRTRLRVEHAINPNHGPQENGPPLFFCFFLPLLLIVEFQTASRSVVSFCGSSHTAATAAARQMSWHHAVWHCELHLPVSTCGWLMCCFIYFLSRLSLIHPRMSLPMLCKSDHCLSLVLLFFISFSLSYWFPVLTDNGYMCSHVICITI